MRLFPLAKGLMKCSHVQHCLDVSWVNVKGCLEMDQGIVVILFVTVSCTQIEMAFSTVWIQLDGEFVWVYCLIVLFGLVVSVAEVVERWVMEGI